MTEADLQRQVEDMLRARPSLMWHHCRDARHCSGTPGLPDIIAVGPSGVIALELKMGGNDLSPGQRRWRWALLAAGIPWLTAWPRDVDAIETELDRLARRAA